MFEDGLRWNTFIMVGMAFLLLLLGAFDLWFIEIFGVKDENLSKPKHSPITYKLLILSTVFAFITSILFLILELSSFESSELYKSHPTLCFFMPQIGLFTYFGCKCCLWEFSRQRAKICLINGKLGSSKINSMIIRYSFIVLIISIIILIITTSFSFFTDFNSIKQFIHSFSDSLPISFNIILLIYTPLTINFINELLFNLFIFYLFTVEIKKAELSVSNHISSFNGTHPLNATLKKNTIVVCTQVISSIICTIILVYFSMEVNSSLIMVLFYNDSIIQIHFVSLYFMLNERKQFIINYIKRIEGSKIGTITTRENRKMFTRF